MHIIETGVIAMVCESLRQIMTILFDADASNLLHQQQKNHLRHLLPPTGESVLTLTVSHTPKRRSVPLAAGTLPSALPGTGDLIW